MKFFNKIQIIAYSLCLLLSFGMISDVNAKTSRIKDIVDIEGVRDNQLVGYGLVVGLNGTGDSLNNSPFTRQSLVAMLERLGVSVKDQNMNTANVSRLLQTKALALM
jgi:flagellar P-ring protein precursor FlgI